MVSSSGFVSASASSVFSILNTVIPGVSLLQKFFDLVVKGTDLLKAVLLLKSKMINLLLVDLLSFEEGDHSANDNGELALTKLSELLLITEGEVLSDNIHFLELV